MQSVMQFMGQLSEDMHMSSLNPGLQARDVMRLRRGELTSELGGLLLMFKSFPIAYFQNHIMQRSAYNGDGVANRAAYLAPLITASTVMGGVALMLNDLASGRDPREIYNEDKPIASLSKFGYQSMMKGGALGPLADLANIWEAADRDPGQAMTGPGVAYATNVFQFANAAMTGEKNRAMNEMMQIGRTSMPFHNLWWSKGIVNNLLLNDLHEFAAPGYKRRIKAAAQANYGAGMWMEEGRAPDLSNVVAD